MTRSRQFPGRAPGLVYRRTASRPTARTAELYCEQLPLRKLAARYGTPLYIYSAETIHKRYNIFNNAFAGVAHTICYSVKANSNVHVLRMLAHKGCGYDVVSGGELARVLLADRKAAKKVVFSGVGKKREELEAALGAGILLFNVESASEFRTLAESAARRKSRARVALRVNPDVEARTHPYISTGLRQHKFGVPIAEAKALYAEMARSKWLMAAGVSVHIGSQITDVSSFGEAMARVAELIFELRRAGHEIAYVDAGGGLGIPYEGGDADEFFRDVNDYARAVTEPLQGMNLHLLLEPGRAIVGPAGVLVTSVLYRKENHGKQFLVVDAAMNDLVRPALYGAFHEIVPVVRSMDKGQTEIVDVVGPVCETGDMFARDRKLPGVKEGDLLAILDAGAYGMALASNYNTRPRAAEVLVSSKTAHVIRRRESVADLLRLESPHSRRAI